MNYPNKLHTNLLTAAITFFIVGCSGTYTNDNVRQNSAPHTATLTDAKGMAYYTFDKDNKYSDASTCYQGCAIQWPPVPAGASTGQSFSKIERTDGQQQLTFNGQPLYYFAGDVNPGDHNGNDMGGVWHLAIPSAPKKTKTTDHYGQNNDSGYY